MSVHHVQAVEMAEIARDRTRGPLVDVLATDTVLTQQAQIGEMSGWLHIWGLPLTGERPAMAWMGHRTSGQMPGMATPDEIATLRRSPAGRMDRRFSR
jgi:uncharacterized protein (DUF305 family)